MIDKIRRNEIYYANLGQTIGSEERGRRPVLIVQNDIGNKHSPTTVVLPITTRVEDGAIIPTHVKIEKFIEELKKGTIMAEQVRTIDKQRLEGYIAELPEMYMKKVNEAMKIGYGLE